VPGAATLFFVNSEGWALTCRHVAEFLVEAERTNARYEEYRKKMAIVPEKKSAKAHRKTVQREFGYNRDSVVEVLNMFVNCSDSTGVDYQLHPSVDLALLRFKGFTRLLCSQYPTFAANGGDLKPGMLLCRLGFPFPEFQNFDYDADQDKIKWRQAGRQDTPRFPMDGMVTRHVNHPTEGIVAFEISTPGLIGQSGGPAFDADGRVWGMQASTTHLDLNFDVDQEVLRGGTNKRITESAFLHVGHCVHVDVMKTFMESHNVRFTVG